MASVEHLEQLQESQLQEQFQDIPRPRSEERVNAATHFLGFFGSVAVTFLVFQTAQQLPVTIATAFYVYLATLTGMYLISALSHAVDEPRAKHALRVLDQAEIYLLIAGTYTPFMAAFVPTTFGYFGLSCVWLAAGVLFLRKAVLQSDVIKFSARSYLMLGWVPALVFGCYVPVPCVVGLLVGGVFYSAGTWFLLNDRRAPYFHMIWHLFVIIASAAHFYVIWAYILNR